MKLLILSFFLVISVSFSQSDIPISKYLNEIAAGNVDKVKLLLPDLMVTYPNDPGVKFLTAAVLTDAMKALDIYSDIVNNSPQSAWADDAFYRIIQFNVILGDNNAANYNLSLLRDRYPSSEFIVPSADLVRTALGLRGDFKSTNQVNINKDVSKEVSKVNKEKTKKEEQKSDIIIVQDDKGLTIKSDDTSGKVGETSEYTVTVDSGTIVPNIPDKKFDNSGVVVKIANDDNAVKGHKEKKDSAEQLKEILNQQIEKGKEAKKEVKKEDKKEDVAKNSTEIKIIEDKKESKSTKWGLQVAIFEKKESAEAERDKYISQRMRTEVITRNVDGKLMYSVIIGHYSSKSNAEAAKIIINQQCNCNPLIIEK